MEVNDLPIRLAFCNDERIASYQVQLFVRKNSCDRVESRAARNVHRAPSLIAVAECTLEKLATGEAMSALRPMPSITAPAA